MIQRILRLSLLLLLATMIGTSCNEVRNITQNIIYKSERERYVAALNNSPLAEKVMTKAWFAAGKKALRDSLEANTPLREKFYFRREQTQAVSYQIDLQEGEIATFRLTKNPTAAQVFMDLHYVFPLTRETELVTSADTSQVIQFEVDETGMYLLRLQPELLVDVAVDFSIIISPVLSFPVEGRGNPDIGSRWGAPRDGGRRKHKGIDIFAPRGTPLLAATDGVISSVRNRGLGGKQVWLQDLSRQQSLYYAHLDSQMVQQGQRVQVGDTIGTVGNTGNARTTPPHLHFGIYQWQGGAIDPEPFVAKQSTQLPTVKVKTAQIGKLARTNQRIQVRQRPSTKGQLLTTLDRYAAIQVLGGIKNWYRVQLFDGTQGYVYQSAIIDLERKIRTITVKEEQEILAQPRLTATPVEQIEAGRKVEILGEVDGFLLLKTGNGWGWLAS